MAAKAANDA